MLALFRRTSDRSTINIASWHSRHSLTWSWILSASRQRVEFAKPRGTWKRTGPHKFRAFNVGSMFSVYAMKHNGGWQFGLTVLGLALSFSQQRPMWYRDLWQRDRDRRDGLRKAA